MERRIALEGCFNFRDLGGYPTDDGRSVRWRRLFRSDALHHLSPRDVERFVGELGIRAVIDLRSSAELGSDGRGLLEARREAAFHHLPLFDGEVSPDAEQSARELTLADRYYQMAEHAKDPIARVIRTLAGADGPAVYHCAAGKDRTGIISALLLGLLGVPDDVIVDDYAATRERLGDIIDRLSSGDGYQYAFDVMPADTLHAEPRTMQVLLTRIRERYGSPEGYAEAAGLDLDVVARLRDAMLTP